MNYRDEELRADAGEYVLGTLSGDKLRQFCDALEHDPELQYWVTQWQESLQPLADNTTRVEPPAHVWEQVAGRINERVVRPEQSQPFSLLQRKLRAQRDEFRAALLRWKAFGVIAATASVLFAFSLYWVLQQNERPQFDTISIVSADGAGPLWIVDASIESRVMRITAIAPPPISANESHELWLVRPQNEGVVSLGILPRDGNMSVVVNDVVFDSGATALAVSLEPKAGSPAATPTGPVLYQGEVARLNVQQW